MVWSDMEKFLTSNKLEFCKESRLLYFSLNILNNLLELSRSHNMNIALLSLMSIISQSNSLIEL